MAEATGSVRWLSETEMTAWRAYIVSTLKLRQRLHRELVEQHDVSLIDYEVLVCLSSMPDNRMRMSELATMLGSTKSRLSHQVGRMEDAGYVRRVKDPEDRRGVTAELTEKGVQLLSRAAPSHVAGVRAHLIDLLTTEEQVMMGEAFTRVLDHLQELDD
ncbi:MarR family winged helix-turn-helix transcriptional regulator [Prauserella muralis]|uniref:MarR family transcriptional regulator n=1 Tax=Prauserella muralis TaxID=588067 RepID=A0A2V4B9C9_9PSEU|nr:MarR family transcriptional regulator [Prauserella muralis]PXY31877.1 MarR family transcriptional regulator [Prauserella muralis]TWE13707.1 MarR family transcriptional regulator [Prauserella muralis]